MSARWTSCPGCGARLPREDGPTHRYLESSPACWRLYGEVLAREYEDPVRWAVHRLTVDAYAVQHPGQPSPQTRQSVARHLMSLCAIFDRDASFEHAGRILKRAQPEDGFPWLPPPDDRGALTVVDVHATADAATHVRQVRAWAEGVWEAWAEHHATVRRWLDGVV